MSKETIDDLHLCVTSVLLRSVKGRSAISDVWRSNQAGLSCDIQSTQHATNIRTQTFHRTFLFQRLFTESIFQRKLLFPNLHYDYCPCHLTMFPSLMGLYFHILISLAGFNELSRTERFFFAKGVFIWERTGIGLDGDCDGQEASLGQPHHTQDNTITNTNTRNMIVTVKWVILFRLIHSLEAPQTIFLNWNWAAKLKEKHANVSHGKVQDLDEGVSRR